MDKTIAIRVSGKVQGVFFRASAKQRADELGLKGFVRNEPDETVYVEASGNDETLNEFIRWCRRGPELARVDDCQVTEITTRSFEDFVIRRS
jgi:acylphosphatase